MISSLNDLSLDQEGAESASVMSLAEAERIRREHFSTEADIRLVGLLFYLLSILTAFVTVSEVISESRPWLSFQTVGAVLLILLFEWLGFGIRGLKSKIRIPACVFFTLSLLFFPVGTLIGGLMLYRLLSKKGRFVMTKEYHEVMAATPSISGWPSRWLWAVLLLIVLILSLPA